MAKSNKSKQETCEKCEHSLETLVFKNGKKKVCPDCGWSPDKKGKSKIETPKKTEKSKSQKVETPRKKSILSVILYYLTDKTDSFTADDVLTWIKKNHPDMTYNDKSIDLHLRALCIGAKSNPSINKFASLNYSKEAKTFQKI